LIPERGVALFYQNELDTSSLEQGDVVKKTTDVVALLTEYHPHYAKHAHNHSFIVLTQSCDLVRRSGGECKSVYITLAPVRPLRVVLERELEKKLFKTGITGTPIGNTRGKSTIEQFLERVFNNNESGLFFYESKPSAGVFEDSCAILNLPIAFRVEHYAKFLQAKQAGIVDVFQAKLGWLLGQTYSRVGTPDMPTKELREKVKDAVDKQAIWLEPKMFSSLTKRIESELGSEPSSEFNDAALSKLILEIPKARDTVVAEILSIAIGAKLIDPSSESKFRNLLNNSSKLSELIK
jgi:hypothetical protein